MPTGIDLSSTGKVIAVKDGFVVFVPRQTRYELQLKSPGQYAGPVGTPVELVLRAVARKVWTVPSGGNFVTPIIGPPRIIQGRVIFADDKQIVVRTANLNFLIDLPPVDTAIDLAEGPITVGKMVNVTALPGAYFEPVTNPVPPAAPAAVR